MTLNVPEAEEMACYIRRHYPLRRLPTEFLALADLARRLVAFLDRNDDEQNADERHALLAEARENGLLEKPKPEK